MVMFNLSIRIFNTSKIKFIKFSHNRTTTFIIIQNFQKTQATDMLFFLFFLMSILCDTFRIFVPLFHCAETYSNFLIAIANITLFGKILAPLSICAAVILSNEDFRKISDQNILIILIASLFFANFDNDARVKRIYIPDYRPCGRCSF